MTSQGQGEILGCIFSSPSASHFSSFIVGEQLLRTWPHMQHVCWLSWQLGSLGFRYQSESILKDDLRVTWGGSQDLGALVLECSLITGREGKRCMSYCFAKECPWQGGRHFFIEITCLVVFSASRGCGCVYSSCVCSWLVGPT